MLLLAFIEFPERPWTVWNWILERVKGFEPSTYTLARYRSTPELHPRLPAAVLAGCQRLGKGFL